MELEYAGEPIFIARNNVLMIPENGGESHILLLCQPLRVKGIPDEDLTDHLDYATVLSSEFLYGFRRGFSEDLRENEGLFIEEGPAPKFPLQSAGIPTFQEDPEPEENDEE